MVEFDSEDKNVQIYKRLYDGQSNIAYKDFFADSHRLQTRFQVWTIPPGGSEGSHSHEEDRLEEIYYVIEGEAMFMTPDGPRPLKAGEAALASPGDPHGIRNVGETELKLAVLYGCVNGKSKQKN